MTQPSPSEALDLMNTLGSFREWFASAIDEVTGSGESRARRAASQDGLQLVWSFVVAGLGATDDLDARQIGLLRSAFPDEMFGSDPDTKFDELTESVTNAYADQWKYLPSDHLCSLILGCVNAGDAHPVVAYRAHGVGLAVATVEFCGVSARGVFGLAKFDSMLKHARVLTEVAISEGAIPTVEQVKAFYLTSDAQHSLSFAFLARIDETLAESMVRVFADQHGTDVAIELLDLAITEMLDEAKISRLSELRLMLDQH